MWPTARDGDADCLDVRDWRDRLHEAALALFTSRGFENVQTVDLCDHARIDPADFRRVYAGPDDLFAEVYDTIHHEVCNAIVRALNDTPASLLDQLFVGLHTYLHGMLDDPRRMLLVGVESAVQGRAFQARRRQTRTLFADLIDEMATTHVDRHVVYPGLGPFTTLALTASVHDLALTWALLVPGARPSLDALVAEAVRLVKAVALAPAL